MSATKIRMPSNSTSRRLRRPASVRMPAPGFTLVELLVVIAILGLLISILLPSLGGARKLARRTLCLTQVRELYNAHTAYLMQQNLFPALNNEEEDGAWQYNYLIYDGEDFDHNFGPLLKERYIPEIEQLYCPVQTDPFHILSTPSNPWPDKEAFDTRAGYARRYLLSGLSYSKLTPGMAVLADVMHLPKVIRSAHVTGLNAAYGDGHANWVRDPGIFTDNELDTPFDPMDNLPIVKKIWDAIEGRKVIEDEDEDDDEDPDDGDP